MQLLWFLCRLRWQCMFTTATDNPMAPTTVPHWMACVRICVFPHPKRRPVYPRRPVHVPMAWSSCLMGWRVRMRVSVNRFWFSVLFLSLKLLYLPFHRLRESQLCVVLKGNVHILQELQCKSCCKQWLEEETTKTELQYFLVRFAPYLKHQVPWEMKWFYTLHCLLKEVRVGSVSFAIGWEFLICIQCQNR